MATHLHDNALADKCRRIQRRRRIAAQFHGAVLPRLALRVAEPHPHAFIQPLEEIGMATGSEDLNSACAVESLLKAAVQMMQDARGYAKEGGFEQIDGWIQGHIDTITDGVLSEVTALIVKLQAEARK
jgi:hypothetical protein